MPCVVCKVETPNGFRYCKPCMDKDIKKKRNEEEFIENRNNQELNKPLYIFQQNFDDLKIKNKELDDLLFNSYKKKEIQPIEKKIEKKVVFEENKIFDYKRQQVADDIKIIKNKIIKIELGISELFNSVFVLVSQDTDNMIHLHGIYSNIDTAEINFKKIVEEAEKYSKIINVEKVILYKTILDQLDTSFDTSLLDDCDMEIIMKKEYQNN